MLAVLVKLIGCSIMESYKISILFPCLLDSGLLMYCSRPFYFSAVGLVNNHCFPYADNLYDVFVNIRDDEAEHCKTMKACQTHGNLRSPHSTPNCLEDDTECVIPENDCEGIVDCVKKSLTK